MKISDSPRILVVTPTLGDSPYLDATVASVARLPLNIVHVLSVPTPRVAELAERYPHTIVIRDAGRSGGIYGAINRGITQAPLPWDWFTYINDDDELLPGFADAAWSHFAQTDPAPVTYGDVALIDAAGRQLTRITTTPRPSSIPALLQAGMSPLNQQGMLHRVDVVSQLSGYNEELRLCADLDFWARAHAAGVRFAYQPQTVASFRLREGQLSGDTSVTRAEQDGIVNRLYPKPVPAWRRAVAKAEFRLFNLPRYLARIRNCGWHRSYDLLEGPRAQTV